ncbi:hypothetical protein LRP67_00010 [Nocardioides sp. cx-169]|uniref:hypothetical protein n=1 Tax=Nocardioides sp. cx-169 TaxID=2899080 RepID=UPI001E4E2ACC|nr:hypothetical protein [Nocardioides sp. cx-169]MCD4532474.1 hypothetical protein [Nocardioides sp. cx-169]
MDRVRLAALLAATTLVVAACSDDAPEPRVEPTPSASPSESGTPTPSPQTEPAKPTAPEQTVRAWVEARNRALGGDAITGAQQLSSPDCKSCADLIDPIAETYEKGGRFETPGWRVLRTRITHKKPGAVQVTTALSMAGGTTYDDAAATPVTYPAEKRIAIFELKQLESEWLVSLIGFLE